MVTYLITLHPTLLEGGLVSPLSSRLFRRVFRHGTPLQCVAEYEQTLLSDRTDRLLYEK